MAEGHIDRVPTTKELETLHSVLSPEERDELLQCLLVAAPRGGEAMLEVLEQTLLCHATEELLSEQGVKVTAQDDELADGHSRGYGVLRDFLLHRMRMSHVYQPVMIKTLIKNGGGATVREIAAAFLALDESQVDYYEHITKTMPGRVLARHGLVQKEHDCYELRVDLEDVTEDERRELIEICDQAVADYLTKRGERLYDHRRQAPGQISGSDRYEVLKRAGGRCELCGVSMEERRLEVDHIIPRSLGGSDDPSNLQALCWLCNANKGARDTTDLRRVREESERRDPRCDFCAMPEARIVAENELAYAVRDAYPVSALHTLIIPKRHVASYFSLYEPERRAVERLIDLMHDDILERDQTVVGFNAGVNQGEAAGQSIFHCHIHLIPRRSGDDPRPRGGVRKAVRGKGDYPPGPGTSS